MLEILVLLVPKLQAAVYDILPFGGRCRKAVLGLWYPHSQRRFPVGCKLSCVWSLISTQTFRRALTASVGRRSEIRTACSVA